MLLFSSRYCHLVDFIPSSFMGYVFIIINQYNEKTAFSVFLHDLTAIKLSQNYVQFWLCLIITPRRRMEHMDEEIRTLFTTTEHEVDCKCRRLTSLLPSE
jgi:hypothetical protein